MPPYHTPTSEWPGHHVHLRARHWRRSERRSEIRCGPALIRRVLRLRVFTRYTNVWVRYQSYIARTRVIFMLWWPNRVRPVKRRGVCGAARVSSPIAKDAPRISCGPLNGPYPLNGPHRNPRRRPIAPFILQRPTGHVCYRIWPSVCGFSAPKRRPREAHCSADQRGTSSFCA